LAGYVTAPIIGPLDTIIGRPLAALVNDLRIAGGKEPLDPGDLKRQAGDVASLFVLSGAVAGRLRGESPVVRNTQDTALNPPELLPISQPSS